MTDRVSVVTGANNGIGFETTVGLAAAGLHVVMACRNLTKANIAAAEIRARIPTASLEASELDLGDFASVRAFAERFRSKHDRLDVLINNAGILLYSPQTNSDGIELQFATNYLGHFLLTAELVELMPDSEHSRIVSLSSVAHLGARIDFDDLTCGGNGGAAYGQSKLACVIFGEELHRRLGVAGKQIRSIPVHPGGSDSGLFDEMSKRRYYVLKTLAPFITHSNDSAAKPSLHAALSPDAAGGQYYGPTGFRELRGSVGHAKREPSTVDRSTAQRLWTLSEQLVDRTFAVD